MADTRELYQQVIIDHSKKPRNFHELEHPTCSAEGSNPLCGDNYQVYVEIDDGILKDVSFTGSGCAISKASGSLMTSFVKGKTIDEIDRLFHEFHDMVTSDISKEVYTGSLGKLAVFSGVREFPLRVKCATLPWHALYAAIHGESETSSE